MAGDTHRTAPKWLSLAVVTYGTADRLPGFPVESFTVGARVTLPRVSVREALRVCWVDFLLPPGAELTLRNRSNPVTPPVGPSGANVFKFKSVSGKSVTYSGTRRFWYVLDWAMASLRETEVTLRSVLSRTPPETRGHHGLLWQGAGPVREDRRPAVCKAPLHRPGLHTSGYQAPWPLVN